MGRIRLQKRENGPLREEVARFLPLAMCVSAAGDLELPAGMQASQGAGRYPSGVVLGEMPGECSVGDFLRRPTATRNPLPWRQWLENATTTRCSA